MGRRVFQIDILHCERCGGRREVIALIKSVIQAHKILKHLGLDADSYEPLPARASPRAAATSFVGRLEGAAMRSSSRASPGGCLGSCVVGRRIRRTAGTSGPREGALGAPEGRSGARSGPAHRDCNPKTRGREVGLGLMFPIRRSVRCQRPNRCLPPGSCS